MMSLPLMLRYAAAVPVEWHELHGPWFVFCRATLATLYVWKSAVDMQRANSVSASVMLDGRGGPPEVPPEPPAPPAPPDPPEPVGLASSVSQDSTAWASPGIIAGPSCTPLVMSSDVA